MTTRARTKQALSNEIEDLRARLAKAEDALAAYVMGQNSASSNGAHPPNLQAFGTAGNLHAAMLAQVSDAVIAVDNAQCVTYLNAAAEQQYAISAAEAIGRKLDELYQFRWLHPEDEAAAFVALSEQGEWRGANIHVRRDGQVLYVESTVSTLRDAAGEPFGLLAVIRDVSDQHKAQETIRYQAGLLDVVDQAVIATDNDGRIVYWNRFAEQLYGWRIEEAIGKIVQEVTPAQFSAEQAVAIMQALQNGQNWSGEFSVQRKDGTVFPAFVTDSPIRNNAGEQIGIVGVSIDISERKLAEERVRQSEAQLRRVLDNLFTFVGVMLPDGTLIEANRAPIEAAGITSSEVIGKKFWDCYWWSYSPQVQAQLRDAVARANEGETVRYDVQVRVAGGARIWIDFQLSPLRDEAGVITHLIPSGMDITERKDAEAQLRDANDQFEKTNALLEAVLAGAPSGVVIFDTELRYVRVNEALARINEMPVEAHIGRTTSEALGPARASAIEPILRQVLETGETFAGMELSSPGTYFLADFYPVQTAAGVIVGVGVTVNDITWRKRREANAAFLGEIGDVLARLSNPDDIMRVAGERISAYLNVSRVFFIEIDMPGDASIVLYDWCTDNLPSTAGRYRIAEYSDESFLNTLAAGDSFVVNDTSADPRLTPDAAAKFAAMQIGSALNTPYLSNGQLKFVLAVQQRAAHEWRDDEIELMRELAVRLWPAIERTQAEKALRQSEDRFRLASQAVQSVIYDWDIATDRVERSRELVNLLGFENEDAAVASTAWYQSRLHPDDASRAVAFLRDTMASGAERIEDEFRLQHRDGRYIWVRDCGIFLRDEHGQAVRCVGSITNITERHEAEDQLRESEARLSLALESGRMGAWDWDLTTDLQFWSPEQEKLFGWQPGKGVYSAEQFFNQVHPDDRGRPSEAERARVSGEDYIEDEFRIIRPDGSVVWIASRSRLHRNAQGIAVRMSGVNMDVTERKRAEDALRASEMKFSRLAEASIIGIITADPERIITANDAFLRMVGYSSADMDSGGLQWAEMTPPEFAELDQKGLAQLIERGWCEPFEKEFIRKDGSLVPILIGAALLSREPLSWICFVVDLTERRLSAERLQKANFRFRIAEEAANSFSYDWNIETNEIERSAGLQMVLGYASEELPGNYETWASLVHPDDHLPASVEQAIRNLRTNTQDMTGFEYRARHKDGRYRWLSERAMLLRNSRGELLRVIGQTVDITERKEAEEALRASEARYRELNATLEARVAERTEALAESREQLRELSAYVVRTREDERARIAREVHDELGGSLTVLKMSLARAGRGHEDNAVLGAHLNDMRAQIDNLVKTVRRIASDLRPSVLDDFGLVAAMEWQAQEWSQRTGIPCRLDASLVPDELNLDSEQRTALFRVFQESLTNVARHAHATTVFATLQLEEQRLVLTVKDNGRGLDPAAMQRKSLGLLGMRERVRDVGGAFEIISAPGEGATVCVRVPLRNV